MRNPMPSLIRRIPRLRFRTSATASSRPRDQARPSATNASSPTPSQSAPQTPPAETSSRPDWPHIWTGDHPVPLMLATKDTTQVLLDMLVGWYEFILETSQNPEYADSYSATYLEQVRGLQQSALKLILEERLSPREFLERFVVPLLNDSAQVG